MALTQSEMNVRLAQALTLIGDVYNALKNEHEHPAIHQDLVEVRWFNTAEVQPRKNQKVIVQDTWGAQYFLTYPFNHDKYPMWWVIPQNNNL